MPIYEYTCHSCGEDFEAIQKFSDPPLRQCECGKEGVVERKLSLSAFHLQGGGWYKDQYGGKPAGNGANGANDKSGADAGNGNGKKESKAESPGSGGEKKKPASSEKSGGGAAAST